MLAEEGESHTCSHEPFLLSKPAPTLPLSSLVPSIPLCIWSTCKPTPARCSPLPWICPPRGHKTVPLVKHLPSPWACSDAHYLVVLMATLPRQTPSLGSRPPGNLPRPFILCKSIYVMPVSGGAVITPVTLGSSCSSWQGGGRHGSTERLSNVPRVTWQSGI